MTARHQVSSRWSRTPSQTNRGDLEVEEDRPARVKGAPVLPSEKDRDEVTHATFRSWCEACVAGVQRKILTSDRRANRRCHWWPWTTDSLVATLTQTWPRSWCSFRGLTAQWGLVKCFVKDRIPAVDCVLAYLDSWGLAEVLLKTDNEPAIQALVDGVRAKRGERTMVEIESQVLAPVKWSSRERSEKDREPHQNLCVRASEEARLQG